MNKLKKVPKRDHLKNYKKGTLHTAPSACFTQEIRIATITNDFKGLGKSLELKNTTKINDSKKMLMEAYKTKGEPRKSANKISKTLPGQSQPLKTIAKTFKDIRSMKLARCKSRSKSKSPTSLKARSTSKYLKKKLSFKDSSAGTSSFKLQKSLLKFSLKKLMPEEDSLVVKTGSDQRSKVTYYNVSSENEESINIDQVKNYCTQCTQTAKKRKTQLTLNNSHLLKQNRAASKIQRAWKRYQTKLLVGRNIDCSLNGQSNGRILKTKLAIKKKVIKKQTKNGQRFEEQAIFVCKDSNGSPRDPQLAVKRMVGNRTDHNYQHIVQRFKREELQRWDEIISIISLNRSSAPRDIQRLLSKVQQQSQHNKKSLETTPLNMLYQGRKKQIINNQALPQAVEKNKNKTRFEFSSSERSIQFNQYDNRKYIEFLDADIFPRFSIQSPKISKSRKISKSKQDLLLQILKDPKRSSYMESSSLFRSESSTILNAKTSKTSNIKFSHRRFLSDNNQSTKNHTLHVRRPELEKAEKVDLEKLIQDFLKYSEHLSKGYSEQYSQARLRTKIAELNQIKDAYNTIDYDQSPTNAELNQQQEYGLEKRHSPPGNNMNLSQQIDQKNIIDHKQSCFQSYDEDFQSLSDEEENGQNDVKYETCATIIIDKLVFQVIQEIHKNSNIFDAFKRYLQSFKRKQSLSKRPKHKKGFATSKTQIELFLTNLLKYLQRQQPNVFKNLEVSTGPSALEMLRFMHSQLGAEDSCEEDQATIMVLPNRVFDAFWLTKQNSIMFDFPENMDQSSNIFRHYIELLTSLNKIFYRCLFDTFNECLDHQRNFGQFGRPFPWKRSAAFSHRKSEDTIRNSVETARKRMIELSIIYCGLIVQKEDMGTIGEESLKQIHEDRLNRLLASDFLQHESRWIIYDDEETEILVEISHFLVAQLVIQAVLEMCSI